MLERGSAPVRETYRSFTRDADPLLRVSALTGYHCCKYLPRSDLVSSTIDGPCYSVSSQVFSQQTNPTDSGIVGNHTAYHICVLLGFDASTGLPNPVTRSEVTLEKVTLTQTLEGYVADFGKPVSTS